MRFIDRLNVASEVAPILRDRKTARKIKVVNSAGKVVGEITDLELAEEILKREHIELTIFDPGMCHGYDGRPCPDKKRVSRYGLWKAAKLNKDPICKRCWLKSSEFKIQQKDKMRRIHAANAAQSPEERRARSSKGGKAASALLTPEQRRLKGINAGNASIRAFNGERRRIASRKAYAAGLALLTSKERKDIARKGGLKSIGTRTPEQLREGALKAWQTRRAKKCQIT